MRDQQHETTCLERPDISGSMFYISIQMNLAPITTCIETTLLCLKGWSFKTDSIVQPTILILCPPVSRGWREQPPRGPPWVSGLVGHFVQTWPDCECSHTVQYLDCSDLNWRCNRYHLFWHGMTLLVLDVPLNFWWHSIFSWIIIISMTKWGTVSYSMCDMTSVILSHYTCTVITQADNALEFCVNSCQFWMGYLLRHLVQCSVFWMNHSKCPPYLLQIARISGRIESLLCVRPIYTWQKSHHSNPVTAL